jgi:hypothetical protein
VAAALRPPPKARPSNPIARFFSIFTDGRAYAGLLFMLFSLATGILYFVVTVVGTSMSLGLAVLIIGIPFFLAFIGVTRVLALVECRLVEAVSGVRMPRRPQHPGAKQGFWARVMSMLADPKTWTTLAYNVLMLPLGILYFVMAVTGLSVSVGFIAAPIVAAIGALGGFGPDFVINNGINIQPYWLNTPAGLVLCFILGVLLLTAMLHVSRAITRGHAVLAKSMLVLP